MKWRKKRYLQARVMRFNKRLEKNVRNHLTEETEKKSFRSKENTYRSNTKIYKAFKKKSINKSGSCLKTEEQET